MTVVSLARMQVRRGTAADWTSDDPILASGEFGMETDTLELKMGDGVTAWTSLPYKLQGDPGVDGQTLLNGAVAPTTEGADGDFYIDTVADNIYGPKTAGAWGSPTSLVGPTGATGATGAPGASATVVNTVFTSPSEFTNIVGSAPTATHNIDVNTSQYWLFTTDTANNFAPNIRGDGSTTLNTIMAVGDTKVVNIRVSNGVTAYYITAITIDGNAQTVSWFDAAPIAGNVSAKDVYSFAITKTAAATFTVLGSQTRFV